MKVRLAREHAAAQIGDREHVRPRRVGVAVRVHARHAREHGRRRAFHRKHAVAHLQVALAGQRVRDDIQATEEAVEAEVLRGERLQHERLRQRQARAHVRQLLQVTVQRGRQQRQRRRAAAHDGRERARVRARQRAPRARAQHELRGRHGIALGPQQTQRLGRELAQADEARAAREIAGVHELQVRRARVRRVVPQQAHEHELVVDVALGPDHDALVARGIEQRLLVARKVREQQIARVRVAVLAEVAAEAGIDEL
jgi:hypothetical protein